MGIETNKRDIFFAQLNDVQSLKKQKYLDILRDKKNAEEIISIFENNNKINNLSYREDIKNLSEKIQKSVKDLFNEDYYSIIGNYLNNQVLVIEFTENKYPEKLLKIENPPYILYCKGNVELLNKKSIAIVGTRNISENGKAYVNEIVEDLVKSGYVIVSGLAKGTDSNAHATTISSGGSTIAVLPGSVTKITPAANKYLAENIANTGLIVSEITEKVPIHKGRFLERNRITSGLSDAIVVIETGDKGGSIKQAEIAIKQGKPVFTVIPDKNNIDAYRGYKKLISMGGIELHSVDDIIHGLGESKKEEKRDTKQQTLF